MTNSSARTSARAAAEPSLNPSSAAVAPAPAGLLRGRLAALAGAAGAAAIGGGEAAAVTYTPTPGIAAAQGIPGFSFVSSTNVTLGELRAPATVNTATAWDVDGSGTDNFQVYNSVGTAAWFAGIPLGGGERLAQSGTEGTYHMRNLSDGFAVNAAATYWTGTSSQMTFLGLIQNPFFTTDVSGQFGFRFTNGTADTYYGWGSLVVDGTPVGQGFKITEAYYNTTPGAAISVGQVPVAVPEPASMTLMALGAAGVAAWRARRTAKAGAESAAETET